LPAVCRCTLPKPTVVAFLLEREGWFLSDTLRRPESEYLLLLVTHYHGVWIIVAAFNEAPAITGVIADLRTVASIANLES
jgi:hypothetical protein